MKKSNLSYKTHLLRIAAILCLLSSYLWVAPSQVHALSAGFQEYYALGNEEQTYSAPEQTQPQAFGLSLEEYLWPTDLLQTDRLSLSISKGDVPQAPGESNPAAPLRAPTLAVDIVSSPWATVDHNGNPGVGDGELPEVFVVEAVITNTGAITDVAVHLDYNPEDDWTLLGGEDPDRIAENLAPGTPYHAYWLVQYPHLHTDIGATHQYTVTAAPVDNPADSVAASATVTTRGTLGPTNQGMTYASAEVVVGVAFTVTVGFDFGTYPDDAVFSPVGNPDFDPGNYRLMASEVRFYNDAGTWEEIVPDRLYFPTLHSSAENAEVTYTFLALTPESSRLCPYAGIRFGSNPKYDQYYCSESTGTIIPIEGEVSLSLTKQASSSTIQQGQLLTYTIHYANNGDLPLSYGWIWDDVDTNIGSIITETINPPSDPDETTDSRVAWYPDDIGSSGQVTSTGTLTFAILVDGDGQDLADNTSLVNPAFFGINPGELPKRVVLTDTVTTIVQAPTITLSKTDGQDTAEPGDALVYTLHITNSGSMTATGLVITDVLPADVNYAPGTATPPETSLTGQTLVWDNLGPIPPNGGTVVITIPVTVNSDVPDETILTNTMTVKYENPAGHVFATKTATDTTTVHVPPTVAFTAASQSGAEDVGTMTITAQLDKVSDLDVTIPFTPSGTATEGAGQDYTITPSPVVIPAGDTSVDITISVNDDSLYEADETVIVTMGTPTNANKGTPAVHTATITDNDGAEKPTVAFTAASQSGAEDVGTMTITAQLDKVSGLDVTIPFTPSGTATEGAGQDYTITPSPVVIPAGDTSVDITITVNDDDLDEDAETVIVTMGTPTNADKGTPAVHTATITDNDDPPTVDFSSATYSVGEGAGTAIITVILDAASGRTVTVHYATSDGTATAGSDYTAAGGTLTFTPGVISQTFAVAITDDALAEDNETVTLTLSSPTNATLGGNNPATLTILDDDRTSTIDFSSATYSVGEDAGTAIITVILDAASGRTVTVHYAASDGTATAGSDYTAAGGTLTFTPGVISQTFAVAITDDALAEDDETVTLTLSSPTNATLGGNNPATLTILDDDYNIYLPIIMMNY